MKYAPEDILHNGNLENLSDYTVFRLRAPRKRKKTEDSIVFDRLASTMDRVLVKKWYLKILSRKGGVDDINNYGMVIVGEIPNGTFIQSSFIVNRISDRLIQTENSTYLLDGEINLEKRLWSDGSKDLNYFFIDGLPGNWRDVVDNEVGKIISRERSKLSDKNMKNNGLLKKSVNEVLKQNDLFKDSRIMDDNSVGSFSRLKEIYDREKEVDLCSNDTLNYNKDYGVESIKDGLKNILSEINKKEEVRNKKEVVDKKNRKLKNLLNKVEDNKNKKDEESKSIIEKDNKVEDIEDKKEPKKSRKDKKSKKEDKDNKIIEKDNKVEDKKSKKDKKEEDKKSKKDKEEEIIEEPKKKEEEIIEDNKEEEEIKDNKIIEKPKKKEEEIKDNKIIEEEMKDNKIKEEEIKDNKIIEEPNKIIENKRKNSIGNKSFNKSKKKRVRLNFKR